MLMSDRPRGPGRLTVVAALGLGAALAACSPEAAPPPSDTAAEPSTAPLLGEYDNRIRLVEGTPYTLLTDDGDTVSVEFTGRDSADRPTVVLSVTLEDGQGEEVTLEHGDVVELDEASWRVSELGFSDPLPGSVTLTRQE